MLDINDAIEMLGASVMGAPVFKRSTKGAVQVWRVERDRNRFRTIHGQLDGAQITSVWTFCEGKNIGKKNETTPEQQAELEVAALYKKKTAQGKYTYDLDGIDVSTFISPMLAHPLKESKVTFPCSVQPKLDGVRCIATANGFFTRQGKPIPVVKHLEESLAPLFEEEPHLVLDGELYNHIYKDRFEELISAIRQQKPNDEDYAVAKEVINFHVYDCPSCEGNYENREFALGSFLGSNDSPTLDGPFSYDTHYAGVYTVDRYTNVRNIEEIYRLAARIVEDGYEGAMVRLNDMPYENKRSYQLQKVKSFEDAEFEVLDIEEGKGNWSGVAKRACLWLPNAPRDEIIYPDDPRVASGEKDATAFRAGVKGPKDYCKKLLDNKADVIGKPATVTYFRLTAKGIPYLPIFKVIRDYE